MADLFISYAHGDREVASDISRALSDLQMSVWSDQKIRAGERWMPEIEKALHEAKVMVLCITPTFLASDWAQFEIGVAISRSKAAGVRVIPLILRDTVVPDSLSKFQLIDARHLTASQAAAEIQRAAAGDTK
jgi:hypothetical protein